MSDDDLVFQHILANVEDMTPPPVSATLTRQTLLDAIQKVNDAPMTVCVGSNTHLVHPQDRNRWTNCAACARVIWVGPDPMPET